MSHEYLRKRDIVENSLVPQDNQSLREWRNLSAGILWLLIVRELIKRFFSRQR
jgi:hypothetical protein